MADHHQEDAGARENADEGQAEEGAARQEPGADGLRLEHWQNVALFKEATRRAQTRHSLQPDKSELIREAIMLHPDLRKFWPR